MGVLFRKSIEKKQILILFICLLLFPSMIQDKEDTNLLFILFSSNYIALILDTIYIWILFTRISKINSVFDKIITRYTKDEFLKKYILYAILSSVIYLLILYLSIYGIVGLDKIYYSRVIAYFIIQTIYFVFRELFCMLSFGNHQKDGKMVLPVLINLVYHYVFVLEILVKIFIGG